MFLPGNDLIAGSWLIKYPTTEVSKTPNKARKKRMIKHFDGGESKNFSQLFSYQ